MPGKNLNFQRDLDTLCAHVENDKMNLESANDWKELRNKYNDLQKEHEEQGIALIACEKDLLAEQNKVRAAADYVAELNTTIVRLENELESSTKYVEKLKVDLGEEKNEVASLLMANDHVKKQDTTKRELIEQLNKDKERLEKEVESLQRTSKQDKDRIIAQVADRKALVDKIAASDVFAQNLLEQVATLERGTSDVKSNDGDDVGDATGVVIERGRSRSMAEELGGLSDNDSDETEESPVEEKKSESGEFGTDTTTEGQARSITTEDQSVQTDSPAQSISTAVQTAITTEDQSVQTNAPPESASTAAQTTPEHVESIVTEDQAVQTVLPPDSISTAVQTLPENVRPSPQTIIYYHESHNPIRCWLQVYVNLWTIFLSMVFRISHKFSRNTVLATGTFSEVTASTSPILTGIAVETTPTSSAWSDSVQFKRNISRLFWTNIGWFFIHLLFYGLLYVCASNYFDVLNERSIWRAANEITRQYFFGNYHRAGHAATYGFLHNVFGEVNWINVLHFWIHTSLAVSRSLPG
jgi:myosin heavy subunit